MSDIKYDLKIAEKIAEKVHDLGGHTYYVGGFVRDKLLGIDNKDVDIEIHGITSKDLESILDELGTRISIGESFGIYNLKGCSVDIAMPRKEKLCGRGHRDFEIFVDPFIGTEKAAKRRDFTVNSMMQDVITDEIVDHFHGRQDLENRIIRHISDSTFIEDPLRVLRAAQFAARFEFTVDDSTVRLCKKMDISALAKERIELELRKALTKSKTPSVFFRVLRDMNQLGVWFKEIEALIGIGQNCKYYPEGDVFEHTMLVLDKAAKYCDCVTDPYSFMLSCVVHDFGKAVCTELIDGQIHSYGHETKGIYLVEEFLKRLTNETKTVKYAVNMTQNHMRPNILAKDNSSIKSTNKLFDVSVDPEALIYLSVADSKDGEINKKFLFERLNVYKEYMSRPYVMGRDLINAGLHPGENFSKILEYSHKLRLAGVDKDSALKQTIAFANKLK